MARDIQKPLGYDTWESFANVVTKARMACDSAGIPSENHFRDVTKMIKAGKGANIDIKDVQLSRYACYLIAMNRAIFAIILSLTDRHNC